MIEGSHKIKVEADALFEETDFTEGKMLVLPGGMPGTRHLGAYKPLTDMLCDWDTKGKQLAAICAAPGMISETGILKEKHATGYPGCKPEGGAIWSEDAAVVDGNLVTGKGPGAAAEFAIEIIRYLAGDIKAEQIRTSTMM